MKSKFPWGSDVAVRDDDSAVEYTVHCAHRHVQRFRRLSESRVLVGGEQDSVFVVRLAEFAVDADKTAGQCEVEFVESGGFGVQFVRIENGGKGNSCLWLPLKATGTQHISVIAVPPAFPSPERLTFRTSIPFCVTRAVCLPES